MAISLSGFGFHVLVAHNGAMALELADQAQVALIDMLMPGLSGAETIPLVRSANPNLKVVACSGCEESFFREELDRLEVELFLAKPFTLESLIAQVEAVFDLRVTAGV